jgi:hypothetical protein
MNRAFRNPSIMLGLGLLLLTGCSTFKVREAEQTFSFAVLADPRGRGASWKNALSQIRDRQVNPKPAFTSAELIVVAGDMDPIVDRYRDYQTVFADVRRRPVFLPVIGNHDLGGQFRYISAVILPSIPGAVRRHPAACDYYLDHKNVRIIAVDAYTELGTKGVINAEGRKWVEGLIRGAPASIDHIFVSTHEPAFPRFRHLADSINEDPAQRDAFWRMLLSSSDRVRAVFVGHTHSYCRMRVLDPEGPAAKDTSAFPDEDGGIYQVDAGAAGNGSQNTIVQVQVNGRSLRFRVLQAQNGEHAPFAVIDEWKLGVPSPQAKP